MLPQHLQDEIIALSRIHWMTTHNINRGCVQFNLPPVCPKPHQITHMLVDSMALSQLRSCSIVLAGYSSVTLSAEFIKRYCSYKPLTDYYDIMKHIIEYIPLTYMSWSTAYLTLKPAGAGDVMNLQEHSVGIVTAPCFLRERRFNPFKDVHDMPMNSVHTIDEIPDWRKLSARAQELHGHKITQMDDKYLLCENTFRVTQQAGGAMILWHNDA